MVTTEPAGEPDRQHDAIVVGGGFTGPAAARELRDQDILGMPFTWYTETAVQTAVRAAAAIRAQLGAIPGR